VRLADIGVIPDPAHPDWVTTMGSKVYFISGVISDTQTIVSGTGRQLWVTDGTSVGTTLLYSGDVVANPFAYNGILYFAARDTEVQGIDLWKTDGTVAGTTRITNLGTTLGLFAPLPLGGVNGTLLVDIDGSLWKTDGVTATPVGSAHFPLVPVPGMTAVSGGYFYFMSGQSPGSANALGSLSRVDAAGNVANITIAGDGGQVPVLSMFNLNNDLYVIGGYGSNISLFRVDPGSTTAAVLASFHTPGQQLVYDLANVGGKLYFSAPASNTNLDAALWTSDGTAAGTKMIADIVPNDPVSPGGNVLFNITDVNGAAYFLTSAPNPQKSTTDGALWKSDGTAAGTVRIRDYLTSVWASPYMLNVGGKAVYSDGQYLWRSDGTGAGTYQIEQISPTSVDGQTPQFNGAAAVAIGDQIYYSVATYTGGALHVASLTPPAAPQSLNVSAAPAQNAPALRTSAIHDSSAASSSAAQGAGAFLAWNASSTNESGFVIERSTEAGFAANVVRFFVPAGVTTFSDGTAAGGTQYYYRVLAVDAGGMSPSSNVIPFVFKTILSAAAINLPAGAMAPLVLASDGLRLLPAGRVNDVPWAGLRQIQITLANVAALAAADVSIRSASGINYGPVTITGSGNSFVLTLARPVASADRLTLTIGNAGIASFTREIDVLPGDANDDGVVNFADFVALSNHFGKAVGPAAWAQGDLNGDGVVNFADFVSLSNNFGKKLPPAAAPLTAPSAFRLGSAAARAPARAQFVAAPPMVATVATSTSESAQDEQKRRAMAPRKRLL